MGSMGKEDMCVCGGGPVVEQSVSLDVSSNVCMSFE